MKELAPPPEALTDPKATEFVRIWAAHKEQHVSIRTDQWARDPSIWGIMLSDLAHHVANAYEQDGVGSHQEIFDSIVSRFLDEVGDPTDEPSGGFVSTQ